MPKPLPEIARCKCGRVAKVESTVFGKRFYVQCSYRGDDGIQWCFFGPTRKTQRGAINAWNRVMGDE